MKNSILNSLSCYLKDNKYGIYRIIGALSIVLVFILLDIECVILKYLNVPCLGCGMTRAWKAVFKGDLSLAYEFHRAYWTVPILFIYLYKGKLLFKKHLWDVIIILMIIVVFIENYLYTYLLN